MFLLQTRRKAPETGEDDDQSEKKFRKCEKSGCPATYPVCFASASERCVSVCERESVCVCEREHVRVCERARV